MNFEFIPVTEKNICEAVLLHISEKQRGLVETVEQCLKEAEELSLWKPIIVTRDGKNVGFAMYGCWINEGEIGRVWLDRFFIDESFQGNGLAKACLPLLLAHIRATYDYRLIYLSVYKDNLPAIALYEKFGFAFTGEIDIGGELVMVQNQ